MTFGISPGVYPQLEDLSERVPNFPTSIGAICFASLRGPHRIQLVTDPTQFVELYGPPTPGNSVVPGNGHDTALQFLQEANALYCIRADNGAEHALGALVLNGGSGYSTPPNVTISSPGVTGTTAQAVARLEGDKVNEVIVTNPGSGYSIAPTVTIAAPSGTGEAATATAAISNGAVEHINLVEFVRANSGIFVRASAQGTTQLSGTAESELRSRFTFENNQTPLVYIFAENAGEWGNGLQIAIDQVDLGITKRQTVTFDNPVLTGQTVQYTYDNQVRTIDYAVSSDNTLALLADSIANVSGAIASVVEVASGTVSRVTLSDAGTGYTSAPTVAITGGEGSGAAAVVEFDSSSNTITGIVVTNPGSGYTSAPSVAFSGGGGSGAAATAEININDDRSIIIEGVESTDPVDLSDFAVTGAGTTPIISLTVERNNIASSRSFNLQVFEGNTAQPREEWRTSLHEQVDGFGSQLEIVYQTNEGPARSNRIRTILSSEAAGFSISNPIAQSSLNGGTDGNTPTDADLINGWNQFSNTNEVTIRLLMSAGFTSPAVQQRIANIARDRRDAFAILDMPSAQQNSQNAVNYRNNQLNINDSYAAIYSPDIEIFDEHTGRRRYIPPSGPVAASYAYTARTRDVWFAPAGLSRGLLRRASGLRFDYNEGDRDILSQAQINTIVRARSSIAIWGEYTLQVTPSALQSVPVRLLMTTIEVAIADSLNSNVFDPNDAQTRFLIRSRIEDFLLPIRRGRGIEEFRVICDERNNPPSERDRRVLNVDVYVKPVLAALYLRLTSVLTNNSANFDELLATRLPT